MATVEPEPMDQPVVRAPAAYARRILVATVGLVPQIVTETAYALTALERPAFVPTEVHLVTTAEGAHRIRLLLLDDGEAHWRRLAEAVGRPELAEALTPARVHVIRDGQGEPLADIGDIPQNTAAADAITALVAELTRDAESALHVSLAGGRKTMGFLMGYALSLFGRDQDRLSHVLVDEPFQSHPAFWFPPPTPQVLLDRHQRPVSTAHAVIRLADIPFVRLRHGLPDTVLEGVQSYSEAVAEFARRLQPPRLDIDLEARMVHCHGRPVRLPPVLFAWLLWLARRRRDASLPHGGGVHRFEPNAEPFLDIYADIVGRVSGAYDRVAARLADGLTPAFVDEKTAQLNRALREALGPLAEPYLVGRVGGYGTTHRGLRLVPGAIRVID